MYKFTTWEQPRYCNSCAQKSLLSSSAEQSTVIMYKHFFTIWTTNLTNKKENDYKQDVVKLNINTALNSIPIEHS